MSKVIDNRVVSMEFDNSQFEKNVQTSMKTLDNLNKTLDNLPETSGKGLLSGFAKSAKNIDLSGISSGIDALNSKFSAFGIAGQEVIRDLTHSAINFGKSVWNTTFGQIKSGGKRRAENIAQSKFTLEGMGFNFQDYYEDIDYAVTGTAYGFDQAAQAASVFASSGVKAGEDMKQALRGISGVAAMTGSSYEEIAYIFEKVNANMKVTNNELGMISGRGLNATAALAQALGKTEQQITEMARKGQIDFKTFAKAMDDAFGEHSTDADKTLSGVTDNIRAQLSRIGQTFYEPLFENNSDLVLMLQSVKGKIKEIKNITDPFAKTLSGVVLDLARRGKTLIDAFDVNKLQPVFDSLTNFIQNANVGLSFSNIIGGIKGVSKALEPLKKAAKDAFSEVFPKKFDAGAAIYDLSKKIAKFGKYFKVSSDTVDKSKRIFKGAFSAISLGGKIFKDLLSSLSPVTDKLKEFGSGAFTFAAKVGDFFTELNQNYEVGKPFESLAKGIRSVGEAITGVKLEGTNFVTAIKAYASFIKTVYNEGGGGVSGVINATFEILIDAVGRLGDAFQNLTGIDPGPFFDNLQDSLWNVKERILEFVENFSLLDKIKGIIDKVKTAFSNLWSALAPIRGAVKSILQPLWEGIKQIGQALKDGLSSPGGFVNLAALLVILEQLRLKIMGLKFKFEDLKKYMGFMTGKNPFNFFNNIDKTISAAKSSLQQLTKELKAKAILEIAGAIGILAISFMLLASIDPERIVQAGAAMGELLLGIAGLLKEMDSMESSGFKDSTVIGKMGTAMIKLSVAVLILAAAMKQLDGLENIGQDILMFAIVLGALIGAAWAVDKLNIKSFNKVATSMILLAFAIKIMASAFQYFDGMQWENVIQGLVSIAGMMVLLVGSAIAIDKFVGSGVFNKVAVGMVVMAVAVKLLASSVQALGSMPTEDLRDGLVAVMGILAAMTLFGFAIDKLMGTTDFVKIGAGFLLLGVSIRLIASAFKTLSEIDPDGMTQAIVVLTFTLVGLTAIMVLANDAILKTGAGLLLVAAAMLVFTAAIAILGNMELTTLLKGIIGMAAALVILGAALYFISGSIAGAAALLIVAVALIPFALALKMLTDLNLLDLAGTILVLVVALAALTVVCYAMTGALVGAAAMLVLSVALIAFGAACAILTALPLADLAGTLLVVLAAIIAFSVVGAILSVLAPALLVFSAAFVVFGAAIALAGGGIALFAMGMEILSVSGVMGATALATIGATLAKYNGDLLEGAAASAALGAALLVLDAALLVATVSITASAVAIGIMTVALSAFAIASSFFAASGMLGAKVLATIGATLAKYAKKFISGAAGCAALGASLLVLSASLSVVSSSASAMAILADSIIKLTMVSTSFSVYGMMTAKTIATIGATLKKYTKNFESGASSADKLASSLLKLNGTLALASVTIASCSVALNALTNAMKAFTSASAGFAQALLVISSSLKIVIKDLSDMLSKGKFKEMSSNAMDGMKEGFQSGTNSVRDAVANLGKVAIEKIKTYFGSGSNSEMGKAGANAVMGLVAGMKSKLGSVGQIAKTLGTTAVNKLKASLKIKSPSRVTMQVGKYFDEGLAKGIDQNTDMATRAADNLADETVSSMSGALATISDAMSEAESPTITPELDLTNVQNGMNSMDSMLNNRQAANISANYNANKIAEQEQISFNQAQLASLGNQLNLLSGILANQPTPEVNANVILQGDADGVFKLVRNQDSIYTKMHGKSAFA